MADDTLCGFCKKETDSERRVQNLLICDECFEGAGGRKSEREMGLEKEIKRLSRKAARMNQADKEHIFKAGTAEAIKILAKKKSEGGGNGERIGSLYYDGGTSVVVYKNPDVIRTISVFGHDHRMVSIKFEDRHDVLKFYRKLGGMLGISIYQTKRGEIRASLGSIDKKDRKKCGGNCGGTFTERGHIDSYY